MTVPRSDLYDVAIVGAGPAGSSLAIRLASAGLKVLLVEQKQFPRAKLCGEFISPECLSHFAELNVLDQMTTTGSAVARTVFYAQNGRSVTVPNEWFQPGSYALGLSRAKMDNILLEKARTVCSDVLENTCAGGLLFDDDKVTGLKLRDEDRRTFQIKSRLTIDATGRTRALVRHVTASGGNAKPGRADFVAFKTHLQGALVNDGDCEIYAYRGGYGGCVQVEGGIHNLCFIVPSQTAKRHGSDVAEIMQNVILKNKRAAGSLSHAKVIGEWLAVPVESYGRKSLAPAEGLLTVGDAGAFIDPFTGSGILLALESSQIAGSVIVDHLATRDSNFADIRQDYRSRYDAAFTSRHKVSSMIRRAAFVPLLAEAVIRCLAASDRLTRTIALATRPKT